MKFHPSRFKVNETWVLFRLGDEPIITDTDGPAICFGLMDAASCYMLAVDAFPGTDGKALSKKNVQEILKQGWAHKKAYPASLIVPEELIAGNLETVVQEIGISMVRAPESQLTAIIGEAREEFRKRFG